VKVVVHDRTDELQPRLRAYAERKLTRLERHFDRALEAEVEFDRERKRSQEPVSRVRIVVRSHSRRTPLMKAEETGPDVQAALDLALDKMDRQVLKLKEKRRRRSRPAGAAAAVRTSPRSAEPEFLRVRLEASSVADAVAALESDGELFHVFLNEDSGEINIAFRRPDGSLAVIEPVVI